MTASTHPLVQRVMKRRATTGILLILLALLLVFVATWKLTLGQRIIARGDLLLYFYPLRDFASAAIREGHLPLWNPYTFMGAPFLANSQAGFFYPLNVVMAWLPVGSAVSWSIVLHLMIATAGMYALARRRLGFSWMASFSSALAFGLGGYLGAQVEHLNQLQVLAWLPLQMLLIWRGGSKPLGRMSLLALLIALQILAGHTQSLYICLVTLAIVIAVQTIADIVAALRVERDASAASPQRGHISALLTPAFILMGAGLLAGLIAAAQLLPTLELTTQSARSGGLPFNEVGSFSWRPWVMARALLPTYGDPLFAEYVTYLGAGGVALALLGVLSALPVFPQQPLSKGGEKTTYTPTPSLAKGGGAPVALALTLAGIILALGVVTPLFGLLYRFLPGFNLFRAQARWLVLFALGTSMLAGLGVQMLQAGLTARQKRIWLIAWLGSMILLIAGLLLGARISPEPEYRSLPALPVLLGWSSAGLLTTAGIVALNMPSRIARRITRYSLAPLCFALLLTVELFLASQFQPYARASDQAALTDLRPATAHLLAGQSLRRGVESGRVLALSGLFFDPGDMPEQTLIYGSQLSTDELYDRIIAAKHKEVLSPNLSLYYRLPSVDGYDGGLLPLKRYADFVQPFTPANPDQPDKPRSVDGRLREFLIQTPGSDWLARMAVEYVITDKTRDMFFDNVYYDLQFSQSLSTPITLPLEPFVSTAIGLVLRAPQSHTGNLLSATVTFNDGTSQTLDTPTQTTGIQPYTAMMLRWDGRRNPIAITLSPKVAGIELMGLTSIDEDAGAFEAQAVRGEHDMRVAYSGDVKIYQNERPAPRALLATAADCNSENGELNISSQTTAQNAGEASITTDTPEQVTVGTDAQVPAWLVLRDACYPGWVARMDGVEVPITCADTLFRAVQVPPGQHTVVFSYEPPLVRTGIALSGTGVLLWVLLLLFGWRSAKTRQ